MKKHTKDMLLADANRLMQAHKVKAIYGVNDGSLFLKKQDAVSHRNELNRDVDAKAELFEYGEAEVPKQEGVAATPMIADDEAKRLQAEKDKQEKDKQVGILNRKIEALQKNVDAKQKALDEAADDKKADAQAKLDTANEKLTEAKKELEELTK